MSRGRTNGSGPTSRREFLKAAACAVMGGALHRIPFSFASPQDTPAPFEEILPQASDISWTHTSGRSPMAHLPETVGPGCAFLDYDNDGWMDIYLVNSGSCDFYEPKLPLRNALYRNNRDGTFTDV